MKNPWVQAARLRTLPLSISNVIIGFSLVNFDRPVDGFLFFLILLLSISLQILSNYANDYGDYKKGTDSKAQRSDRMLSSQKISELSMKKALIGLSLFIFILGISILFRAYLSEEVSNQNLFALFILGVCSILAAIFYTVGKKAYGYQGLGDLAVLLFFGLVPVLGIQLISGASLTYLSWMGAIGIGLLSVVVLNTNNYRDLDQDRESGKRTLAVILGEKRTLQYQRFLLLFGFSGVFLSFAFYMNKLLSYQLTNHYLEMLLLFGVFSPSAVLLSRFFSEMKELKPGNRDGLNAILKSNSLSILLLCLTHLGLSFYVNALLR